MASLIGQTVSHYKILEKLGEGGMGVVYRAEDTRLKRAAALKFLPQALTADPAARERFTHEAQAASALDHPNICNIYEINESDDGQLFMAMACYDGETLKKKIERGPVPVHEAVEIAGQVAQGLVKAHEAGIIHRDIKPANIIITNDGIAKILDFGLAKLSGNTRLTKTGSTTAGTAAYMSPEQALGVAVDARTDVWSLGVVLYEMLAGRRPFENDYEQALVYSILRREPKAIRQARAEVPEELEKITRRAMAKGPEDRYQAVTELVADLESYGAGTPLSQQTRRFAPKRMALLYGGIATVILVAAIGVAVFLSSERRPVPQSLAVLPFVNASGNQDVEYLCDALAEDITDQLNRLPQMKRVIPFTEAYYYKGKDVAPMEVGKQLGVETILSTRLYRDADTLKLSMELINIEDNRHIWRGHLQERMGDISAIPQTVFLALAGHLSVRTASRDQKPATRDSGAYQRYALARYHYHKSSPEDLRLSRRYCLEAIALDSTFALAYAGLAEAYVQLSNSDFMWRQIRDSARTAARRAIELDSLLEQSQFALGYVELLDGNLRTSEQLLTRALALNTSYSEGFHAYAHLLSWRRESDRAIKMMNEAIALNPHSVFNRICLGNIFADARRWDKAIQTYDSVAELDSAARSRLVYQYWNVFLEQGGFDKARAYAQQAEHTSGFGHHDQEWMLACVDAASGRKSEAASRLRELSSQFGPGGFKGEGAVDEICIARLYALLGKKLETVDWIEKGFSNHAGFICLVSTAPEFDGVRDDPRVMSLLLKAGFVEP